MSIAVDNTSSGTDPTSVELTVAHTVSSVEGGGILIVTVQVTDSSDTDRVISTVTHNGEPCTHLPVDSDDADEKRTEIWYRANPTTGGSPNIVVTPSGSCTDLTLGAISLTGADGDLFGVIDSYSETNQDSETTVASGATTGVGQSFDSGSGGILKQCKFHLRKLNSPTGNAVAKLYSHSGTYGTSSVPDALLATSDTFDVSTLTTSLQLITFTFSTPYTLSASTKYVIVFEYQGASTTPNVIRVGKDTSSPSHGGNYSSYLISWSASDTTDTCFYTYFSAPTQIATGDNEAPTLSITTIGTSSYAIDSLSSGESGNKLVPAHTPIHNIDVGSDTHAAQYVDAGGAGAQTMNYTDPDSDTAWVMSAVAVTIAVAAGPAGIKTINELAIASVKTIQQTAIASVKTINESAA